MSRVRRIFFMTAILSLFLSPPTSGQQDVSEYQKRLDEIKQQINRLRFKIDEESKKESSFLSRLDTISFNKNLLRKEIDLGSLELQKLDNELASIKRTIPLLKAKLEEEKASIEKTLVTLYKFGRLGTLHFILRAENINTFITHNKHLTLLARHQEKIIASYLDTLNELKLAEEELESKKVKHDDLLKIARKKREDLEVQERKHRALISETKQNKKLHLQALEELSQREAQLQLLIEKLTREEVALPIAIVPLYEKKGTLPWPIEGEVVTSFGKEVHPQFKTVTMNNGIEIAPRKNTIVVKAVHTGKVVYCDHLQGYGNLIIIDHGMNFHTLYGHCLEFLVKKGELLKTGQPIALVGDTGSFKGITLYFEIREKTKPSDPLQWLKRR